MKGLHPSLTDHRSGYEIDVTAFGNPARSYVVTPSEPSVLDVVRNQGGEIVTAEVLAYAIHQMCPTYLQHEATFHLDWAKDFMTHIRQTVG